jgi:hypothetical protein
MIFLIDTHEGFAVLFLLCQDKRKYKKTSLRRCPFCLDTKRAQKNQGQSDASTRSRPFLENLKSLINLLLDFLLKDQFTLAPARHFAQGQRASTSVTLIH